MSATITIPAELEQQVLNRALSGGQQFEEFALNVLRQAVAKPYVNGTEDDAWLDVEYMAACRKEADASVTLDSVRKILAKLPNSLADDVIAERDERF